MIIEITSVDTSVFFSWAICRTLAWHHFTLFKLMPLCLEQGSDEWCQRRRGPRSSYDVMSGRSILGFWAQMMGLWGSKLSHLMLFTYNLIQLAHSTSAATLLAIKARSCMFEQRRKLYGHTHWHTHKHVPVLKHINKQKHSLEWTQPKASPSHCCPSSEIL